HTAISHTHTHTLTEKHMYTHSNLSHTHTHSHRETYTHTQPALHHTHTHTHTMEMAVEWSQGLTIYFVGHHQTGDLRPVVPQLLVPDGQVPVGDLPLDIKHLPRTHTHFKGL